MDLPGKNPSPHLNGGGQIADMLERQVLRARRNILIQSPYLVLSPRAQRLFGKMRSLNPRMKIQVSTNSLAATDAWVAYGLTHKQKRLFVQDLGLEIWEFKPHPGDIDTMMALDPLLDRKPSADMIRRDRRRSRWLPQNRSSEAPTPKNPHTQVAPSLCIHAKSMVLDDRIALIGSYNLDPRSANLTTEIGLMIDDEEFAALLAEDIRRDMHPRNSYYSAPKKQVHGFRQINQTANRVSEALPIDLWPFQMNSNYELRLGGRAVTHLHPRFHRNWKDVGELPRIKPMGKKQLGSWISTMFGNLVLPLL